MNVRLILGNDFRRNFKNLRDRNSDTRFSIKGKE